MFKILTVMLKKIKCDVKNIKRDIYNITLNVVNCSNRAWGRVIIHLKKAYSSRLLGSSEESLHRSAYSARGSKIGKRRGRRLIALQLRRDSSRSTRTLFLRILTTKSILLFMQITWSGEGAKKAAGF